MSDPLPTTPPPRYDSLDAWRGLACGMVIIFHAAGGYLTAADSAARIDAGTNSFADRLLLAASKMWVGVPLFFVISGYCVTASAVSTATRPRPTADFLRRRFRRIYPPLWAYLAVTAAVLMCWPPSARPDLLFGPGRPLYTPGDLTPVQWLGTATLTEGWRPHLGGPPTRYFSGQLWSLGYEEQFYLIVGIALLLPRRCLLPALAVVTAVVALNVLDLGSSVRQYQWPARGLFMDGSWLAFAAGVGVYARAATASAVLRIGIDGLLSAGAIWAWSLVPSLRAWQIDLAGMLAPAFVFALTLGWLRPFDARLNAARPLAPLRFCGRMCYSLYLVHAPAVAVVAWLCYRLGATTPASVFLFAVPACTAAAVAAGVVFHRWIERPFLNPIGVRTAGSTPSAGVPSRPSASPRPPRPSPCT